jgi:hypothetical protein
MSAIPLAFTLGVALVLAVLLGPGTAILLVAAIAAIVCHLVLVGRWPPAVGAARSALEILVPGMAGWLAVAGPTPIAAPMAVTAGVADEAAWWLQHNWLVPVIFVAFTFVHFGSTAVSGRYRLVQLRRTAILGYLIVISAMAVAARPFHAGAVTVLFAVQWPFQAAFQSGYVRWHWQSVHLIALLAMLLAALGARQGP